MTSTSLKAVPKPVRYAVCPCSEGPTGEQGERSGVETGLSKRTSRGPLSEKEGNLFYLPNLRHGSAGGLERRVAQTLEGPDIRSSIQRQLGAKTNNEVWE